MICGPPRSGKTHLAHLLVEESRASYALASDFAHDGTIAPLTIVDGLPCDDSMAFLDAYERALHQGARLLLVGEGFPSDWSAGVADLRTRLAALPRAQLDDPDEALIKSIISKAFSDRQIKIAPDVIDYAVARLPRTFTAALSFVEIADMAALAAGRRVSRPFVQSFIDHIGAPPSTATL